MGKPFVLQRKLERGMRLGYIQGAQWCVDAVNPGHKSQAWRIGKIP
jgi:hypothetical protein